MCSSGTIFLLTAFIAAVAAQNSITKISKDARICPTQLIDDGYLHIKDDICYRFVLYRANSYGGANAHCQEHGGHLVSIKSAKVNNFLHRTLKNVYNYPYWVWIGLKDTSSENNFYWEDGTSLSSNDYSHWGSNEGQGPHYLSGREDCVAMDENGWWHDVECAGKIGTFSMIAYVCQYPTIPAPGGSNAVMPAENVNVCPPEVMRDNHPHSVFQGHCYQFVLYARVNYGVAKKTCGQNGGLVVQPKTADINSYLSVMLQKYHFNDYVWIGLNDKDNDYVYKWEDGTYLGNGFKSWALGEGPQNLLGNTVEDCVAMGIAGKWHDFMCIPSPLYLAEHKLAYICEYKSIPSSSHAPPAATTVANSAPTTVHPVTTTTTTATTTTETALPSASCPPPLCKNGCENFQIVVSDDGCRVCQCSSLPFAGSVNRG